MVLRGVFDAVIFFTFTLLGVGEGGNFKTLDENLHFLWQIRIDGKKLSRIYYDNFFYFWQMALKSTKLDTHYVYALGKEIFREICIE